MPDAKALTSELNPKEPQFYYVENVDGPDFTFYLSSENNERLLSNDGITFVPQSGADHKKQSQANRFSESTQLKNIIRIAPLLTPSDLIDDGTKLLEKLNAVLSQSQAEPGAAEDCWGELSAKLTDKLKTRIKDPKGQQGDERFKLLQTLLKELNHLLANHDFAEIDDSADDPGEAERQLIKNFSLAGQQAFKNRKKFNRQFQEAIKLYEPKLAPVSGRALICRSYQGKLLSVSFREKLPKSTYQPDDVPSKKFPFTIKDYCDVLYQTISCVEKRGLLVITGETNSSKSEIATGLIHKYLDEQKATSRRPPHLVTFEEPIEKFYASVGVSEAPNLSVKMPAQESGIDYTPRERGGANQDGKDVEALKEALEDALRQTPTVLFVGETRDKADWRRLIDFASTGHLIVTTAHAGSLTEAMHKIFEALRIKTAAERSEIANCVLGIVHIRGDAGSKLLVPAVWRRTLPGKHALTAEGLSSLLPYKPKDDDGRVGCLGRAWFAGRLEDVDKQKRADEETTEQTRATVAWEVVMKNAIRWDLEGI